jgi:hypothetical protein
VPQWTDLGDAAELSCYETALELTASSFAVGLILLSPG